MVCSGGVGVDAVFAARLFYHAAKPALLLGQLFSLCAPNGALCVLDYAHHTDESMRERADLWLGFSTAELTKLAAAAGFAPESIAVTRVPAALCGSGPDHHLPWQVLCARRPDAAPESPGANPPSQEAKAHRSEKGVRHG